MKKSYFLLIAIGVLLILGAFKCPIYAIFGVPCPTCGMTRAWQTLFCGDIGGAFLMHPLFLLPIVFFLPYFRKEKWIIAAFLLLLAVWAVRMALMFPQEAPMNFNYDSVLGEFLR